MAGTFRRVTTTCFNPRAREGRDVHADARFLGVDEVSTHAPARGATWAYNMAFDFKALFQPTRPRGARLFRFIADDESFIVSTHAPARGATLYR